MAAACGLSILCHHVYRGALFETWGLAITPHQRWMLAAQKVEPKVSPEQKNLRIVPRDTEGAGSDARRPMQAPALGT
jgi:hypothetical protein